MATTFLNVTGDYISNNNQIRAKDSRPYVSIPNIDQGINKQVFGEQNPNLFVGCFKFGSGTGIIANTRMSASEETYTKVFIG